MDLSYLLQTFTTAVNKMFICPTQGSGDELDFLVNGTIDDFKIIVFSDNENYKEGIEFLKLASYEPREVSMDLFKNLAKKDKDFSGIILNIHSENKIITKEELRQMRE